MFSVTVLWFQWFDLKKTQSSFTFHCWRLQRWSVLPPETVNGINTHPSAAGTETISTSTVGVSYLTVRSSSGLCVGAETRILVGGRRRRRLGPGQTCPPLQCDELGLSLQSTLLSVPLQSSRVTLRGRNEPPAGPMGRCAGCGRELRFLMPLFQWSKKHPLTTGTFLQWELV